MSLAQAVERDFGSKVPRPPNARRASAPASCRILYLVGQLGAGGLERQLLYLLEAIDRDRFRPAVVVWNPIDRRWLGDECAQHLRSIGIPVYFAGTGSRYMKLAALRRLVAAHKPEVVHSYSFFTNFAVWWSTRGTGAIPVGSIRNNFVSDCRLAGSLLGRLSARWPRHQICNSWCARDAVDRTSGPFKPSRVYVVGNRLDIGRFPLTPTLPTMPVVLGVGRLFAEKRWDRLISAMAAVAARGMTFQVRLAGGGPLLETLQHQAARLGVGARIEFLGHRDDVTALLASSTFLIHTADEEGCPNVVMEAMACGRAVVATDAGDIRHLVEHGKTGFVVRRGDDDMLARCIMTLIQDRDLCIQMGQAARKKAEGEFAVHRLVSDTLDAYQAAGWSA